MQRYHPNFPTEEEVKDSKYLPHSDHLPVMTDIPLVDDKVNQDFIRCVSWNIFNPFFPGGYGHFREDIEFQRVVKVADSLREMTRSEARPDFIFLQEAMLVDPYKIQKNSCKNPMISFLEDCKNNGFEYVHHIGNVTIYRSDKFKLQQKLTNIKNEKKETNNILTTTFQDKDSLKKMTVHNVHLEYSEDPTPIDNYVKMKLNESKDDLIIMGGDFNCRVVTHGKQNLVSGLVSSAFRSEAFGYLEGGDYGYQGCDWTDGFFYTHKNNVIHQPKRLHTLDPATGAICDDNPIPLQLMPLNQRNEVNRLRPFMTVAEEHDKHIEILFGSKAVNWLTTANFQIEKKQYSNACGDIFFGFRNSENDNFVYHPAEDIAYFIAGHDDGLVFSKELLNHFKEALKKIGDKYLFSKAEKVYYEANTLLDSKNISTEDRQFISKALVDAIYFIQNSLVPKAVQKLQKDATTVKGAPSRCKKFLGALAMLVGAAIIGLSFAGIPFTGGASLIAAPTVGSFLILSGAGLFYNGRSKSLSKHLSTLADVKSKDTTPGLGGT